jgi:hypothetical protein
MFFVFKGSEDKGEKAPPFLKDGVARFIFMFTFSLKELNKKGLHRYRSRFYYSYNLYYASNRFATLE